MAAELLVKTFNALKHFTARLALICYISLSLLCDIAVTVSVIEYLES